MWAFSWVHLFTIPWTAACQAPLSMGFSRQEYWSGLPRPPPGDLPDPRIKLVSLMSTCIGRWVLYHQCRLGSSWGSPIGSKYFLNVLNFYSVNRVIPRQNDLMMQFTRKWTGSSWNTGKCFITSRELPLFFNKRIRRVIYFNLPDFTQVPHLRTL